MKKFGICFLSIILLVNSNLLAIADDCEDKMTQMELNICAHEEYKKTDKELNVLYNKVTKKLNKKEKATLIKAQLNWIKFRDNHCEIYKLIYDGGSIMPLMYSKCLTELTKHRTEELKTLYENINH